MTKNGRNKEKNREIMKVRSKDKEYFEEVADAFDLRYTIDGVSKVVEDHKDMTQDDAVLARILEKFEEAKDMAETKEQRRTARLAQTLLKTAYEDGSLLSDVADLIIERKNQREGKQEDDETDTLEIGRAMMEGKNAE